MALDKEPDLLTGSWISADMFAVIDSPPPRCKAKTYPQKTVLGSAMGCLRLPDKKAPEISGA
ncbi:hypothetical protein ACQ4WP_28435 [Janthinobacterium sp. GB4P2]|uniref:hypothetical protein n=1 Tax=Janthinobacterium sp. GB4P2 TaxID=3424189 RepID=UPI003F1ECA9D